MWVGDGQIWIGVRAEVRFRARGWMMVRVRVRVR
jgi:hypothetical protein